MASIGAYAFIGLSAFFITFITLPHFIRRMHLRGMVGKDMNKPGCPPVAEMGGTIVLLGFVFSIMLALFLHSHFQFFSSINLLALLAAMLTIVVVGVLGIVDDIIGWKKGIRQYQHALIPMLAALPLMVLPQTIGNTAVEFPFIGFVNFGIWYSLIVVPLAVTGASNATNILAGLNGLEAGLGILMAAGMLIVAIILGEPEVAILMLAMMGALLGFLWYNRFPAKIFPGDSLTLMMGAGIAAASIIGNMEKVGLMLFGLYFIELVLKARTFMQAESFGMVQPDGTLQAPEKTGSLTHIVMRLGKFNERQVVYVLWGLQAIVVLITLFVFWTNFMGVKTFTSVRGVL